QLFNDDKRTSRKNMIKKLFLKSVIQDAESKAISQIEEKLEHAIDMASEDLDIIEIELPPIKTEEREEVLEAIHNRDGYMKGKVHKRLMNSIDTQLPSWEVLIDVIAVVNMDRATASARSSLEVPYLGHWGIGVAFDAAL
ncbi:4287_t:CDS:2, partial [Paraglomus occultum]